MITIITNETVDTKNPLLRQAFRLRHQVFVEELGWKGLDTHDSMERDRFDDRHAVHMVKTEGDQVAGYQRLLPTMRPHLLSEIYPELCDGKLPRAPEIYEWTRFCVAKGSRGDGRGLGVTGAELVLAFVEWGLACGVTAMVVEMAPVQLLKFVQCHFLAFPLGLVRPVDGEDVMAVLAKFDQRTRARLIEVKELGEAAARKGRSA